MSNSNTTPHVVVLSSSGAGHITPLLRLAASLVHRHCQVTLITCQPILTLAESQLISRFLLYFPQVQEKQIHLLPYHHDHDLDNNDPFLLQWKAARLAVTHLLPPLLSSFSPFPSVIFSDVTLYASTVPVAQKFNNLPVYTLFPSCARMFSFFAYYPTATSKLGPDFSRSTSDFVEIPGLWPLAKSSIPPLLLDPNSLFSSIFMEDSINIKKLNGVLIMTLEILESDTLNALKSGKVVEGLPPIYPIAIGPCEFEKEREDKILKWLEDQCPRSVVYMCFGSKAAMSRKQTKEIGEGLIRSGYPFLWVVKDKEVDKEDAESLKDVLGDELMIKMKDKGLVVKEWVNQGEILGHKAVGGFVTHCGWNSVIESAWHGVRLLAWPPKGDQKVCAEAMVRSGLGKWTQSWGWAAEMVIKGEELGEKIKEMMGSEVLKLRAEEIREEARKAFADGGSCDNALKELIEKWKNSATD